MPAQVAHAAAAKAESPAESLEPGKFLCGFPGYDTTGGLTETADPVQIAVGVGKCMLPFTPFFRPVSSVFFHFVWAFPQIKWKYALHSLWQKSSGRRLSQQAN